MLPQSLGVPLLALFALAPANRAKAHLEVIWEAQLGPALPRGSQAFYPSAVCADGSVHFSDGTGRLIQLRADGTIRRERNVPELETAITSTCTSTGRLHFATRTRLLVTVDPESEAVRSSPLEPRPVYSLAEIKGELVALVPAETSLLHRIDGRGRVVSSFGAEAAAAMKNAPSWYPSVFASDRRTGELTVFSPGSPDVFRYDGEGRLARRFSMQLPPPASQARERVRAAASVPGGSTVVQVDIRIDVGVRRYESDGRIDVIDRDGRVLSAGHPLGVLMGADSKGDLYFQGVTPQRGIRLIKARLVEPPAPENR